MSSASARGSLYAGLMSGTSMDGVDAGLFRFGDHRCETVATLAQPYPTSLRERLLAATADPLSLGVDDVGVLDREVGIVFRDAANALLATMNIEPADVSAIGSHGQTLRHRVDLEHPFSLQIGDPNTIARGTGVTTVADFRRRDVAAGGEGAPLAPGFHRWLFGRSRQTRCVLNLGGIANLSVLRDGGEIIGFDNGPANTLMDAWIRRHRNVPYDDDGAWAKSGTVDPRLLEQLLADDYFDREPPKSTGFEYFNMTWLEGRLSGFEIGPVDVQATLLELTVQVVANDVERFGKDCVELLVCGGGASNGELVERLTRALEPLPVASTANYGLDPKWVEAAAFAWLARQTLNHAPGNVPSVTGAASEEILGAIYPGN